MTEKPSASPNRRTGKQIKSAQPKQVHELKITLNGSKPPIWRCIAVASDIRLSNLHKVIQTVMGWDNYHLHQFVIPCSRPKPTREYLASLDFQKRYEVLALTRDSCWSDPRMELDGAEDERKVSLQELAPTVGSKLIYEYDFGDGWKYMIEAVKIGPPTEGMKYPVCLSGQLACPPEDCGGIWGYYGKLEILKNPKYGDYEDILEWMGEDCNPEYFNIEEINAKLAKRQFV